LLARHGTLFKFLADLTAAAVAVVVALLLLSALSIVSENSLHHLPGNLSRDWLVVVCVMVALSLAGFYRTSRRTLQPNTYSELKDLAFAIAAGGVLALGLSVIGHGAFNTSELPSAQVVVLVTVAIAAVVRGISDAELNDVLIPVPVKDGLLLLPSGPIPPNPSGLRSGARTWTLSIQLAEDFGVVVVGTSPPPPVTDASVLATFLAAFTDAVILVAAANTSTKRDIRQALAPLSRVGAKVVATVLNRASQTDFST